MNKKIKAPQRLFRVADVLRFRIIYLLLTLQNAIVLEIEISCANALELMIS